MSLCCDTCCLRSCICLIVKCNCSSICSDTLGCTARLSSHFACDRCRNRLRVTAVILTCEGCYRLTCAGPCPGWCSKLMSLCCDTCRFGSRVCLSIKLNCCSIGSDTGRFTCFYLSHLIRDRCINRFSVTAVILTCESCYCLTCSCPLPYRFSKLMSLRRYAFCPGICIRLLI